MNLSDLNKIVLIDPAYFLRWQGGENYLRSLVKALRLNEVSCWSLNSEQSLSDLGFERRVEIHYLKRYSIDWFIKLFGVEDTFLKRNPWISEAKCMFRVHNPALEPYLPQISWIPDFQHLELPENFSRDEIAKRNLDFRRISETADLIVLSSSHAAGLYQSHYKEFAQKARVLKFTADLTGKSTKDFQNLDSSYGVPKKYLYLPGQWWKHKNHPAVFEAVMKSEQDLFLVTSGKMDDYRHPEYQHRLLSISRDKNRFLHLGSVPYSDVLKLMWNAHAVLNPSTYEGWSTTIEEAKILGKPLAVSDIEVNIEQVKDYDFHVEIVPVADVDAWEHKLNLLWNQPSSLRNNSSQFSENRLKEVGSQFISFIEMVSD